MCVAANLIEQIGKVPRLAREIAGGFGKHATEREPFAIGSLKVPLDDAAHHESGQEIRTIDVRIGIPQNRCERTGLRRPWQGDQPFPISAGSREIARFPRPLSQSQKGFFGRTRDERISHD